MDLDTTQYIGFNLIEEAPELRRAVPRKALADHSTGGDVEGSYDNIFDCNCSPG